MGVVAEIGRLAVAAWSPGGAGAGYIAAGTYAGAIDPSFTSSASLEIISVDIQRAELKVVSDVRTADKFGALDWSVGTSKAFPAGLIAGGLSDGTVRIWDAATLLRSPTSTEDENKAVVFGGPAVAKHHTGPVSAVTFNALLPSKLASGSADGQVLVWDLSNPSQGAVVRSPLGTAGKPPAPSMAPKDEVSALAWNKKLHPILASGTAAGVTNVWDLRQGKQVISIRNSKARLRVSSLSWHPEIATQIVVSSNEGDSPGALLWDLRNASAPIMTYPHHAPHGIAASCWCPHDSDLLLTSSRDSRTVALSISTGEIVSEAPVSTDWNFDVKWSPRVPGLYLASSFDGRLSVNSLLTSTTAPVVSSETVNALAESFGEMAGGFEATIAPQSPRVSDPQRIKYSTTRPPKWLRKQVSVSFGFGGQRASVSAKSGPKVSLEPYSQSYPGLKECSEKLDGILMDVTSDDPTPVQKLCNEASAAAETPDERMAWDALGIMFQTDSRRKLLNYLGFETPPKDAGDDIAMPVYGLVQSQPLAVPVRPVPTVSAGIPENDPIDQSGLNTVTNGAGGLSLDGPAPWDITEPTIDGDNSGGSILDGNDVTNGGDDTFGINENNTNSSNDQAKSFAGMSKQKVENLVKQYVIVGDFQSAVDACLHLGRTADALVIAHAGGPDLWFHTQAAYIAKEGMSSGSGVIGAVAGPQSKMDDYIRASADSGKDQWKEALAVLLTYSSAEEFPTVCSALGQRLLEKKKHSAALFCFICAGNTRMAVTSWMSSSPVSGNVSAVMMADRIEMLISLVRKIRVVTAAALLGRGEREIGVVKGLDDVSGSVLCEFSALLAAQGDLETAITYLSNLDPDYASVYGSAGDILAQATEGLAAKESAISPHRDEGFGAPSSTSIGNSYDASYNYGSYQGYSSETQGYGVVPPQPNNWENTAAPPAPAAPSYVPPPPIGQQQYNLPSPSTPPAPIATPPRPAGVFSAPAGAVERTPYDPSAAYKSAPTYGESPYAVPPVPAAPPVHAGRVSATDTSSPYSAPTQYIAPMPAAPPPPAPVPVPAAAQTIPAAMNGSNFGMGPGGVMDIGGDMGMPAPPPPPPPSDGSGALPAPYHTNARPGSGATLPPSAEVAVAETRRSKPLSSSGTPGGPPRRSGSTSSSLSALGNETVYLDKADTSKVPSNQQVIVKSLRGAFMYASNLNQSGMYRRKMDDVNKKLGRLVNGLNAGVLDAAVVELLIEVGKCIEKGNYDQASVVVGTLTRSHWDSNSQWIQALKRLIDCVLTGH